MNLADVAIRRPVFTAMVTLGLMILGLVSFRGLGVDLFPDINFPIVSITTVYPGAGPAEVESLVSRPLEDALSSINGLDRVKSFSREGVSVVVVQFKLETDIKLAAVDVREKVAKVRAVLPRDIEDPVISRVDPGAQPIMLYTVSGEQSPQELRRITEDLVKKRLESVEGVAAVNVLGGLEKEFQILLSAPKLQSLNLTPSVVARIVTSENMDVPVGRITSGGVETVIRARGQFHSIEEIGDVILPVPNGAPVKLREVAEIVEGTRETRLYSRVNGKPSVTFQIVKGSGTNTIAIVKAVEKSVDKLRPVLPGGIAITKIFDSSVYIEENTHEVNISIFYGGAMAILIIFLFMLDWRSTFISALALPTSVVTTFFAMYLMGFTLNMMSLLALSLAIGLLVDDAVVVRENIYRHLEMGEDPMTAASKGTSEIALAVMATTFTIVAVFVPVAFTSGLIGQFFREFGLTVAAAVMVSLFIAFTLDPMLSARLVKPIAHDARERDLEHWFKGPLLRFYQGLDQNYRKILAWSLRHRVTVMLMATAMFFGSVGLVKFMGTEFFPKPDRAEFMMYLEMPAGFSIDAMDKVVMEAEKRIAENPHIVTQHATVGENSDPTRASIRIRAVDKNDRPMTLTGIMEDLRARLGTIPDLKLTMAEIGFIEGAVETPIVLNVRGDDFEVLKGLADRVREIVKSTPGTTDVDYNYVPGKPELQVLIDRQRAGDAGVSMAELGLGLRVAVEGDTSSKFREGERQHDIRVRLRDEDRTVQDLQNYTFMSRTGRPVQLSEIADIATASGPSVIEREGRQRQITITGNIINRSLGEVVSDIQKQLDAMEKPEGYAMAFTGEAERMADSMSALGFAFILGIIFIYLVLASQFESFIHPFTIMFSLPLAVVGAMLGLFLTGNPLGMSTFIGIILLMGLVTKNAILLVDYTNQLREEKGMDMLDALLEAGPTRLRPILMTSMAMILGMLPTAVSTGSGSEFRSPMAIAVIGGVATSTVLTLVVVPVVYTWMDRLTLKGRAERRRKGQPPAASDGPTRIARSVAVVLLALGLALLPGLLLAAPASQTLDASGSSSGALPTWGQETALTLDEAYRLAVQNNPDLEAARSRLVQTQLLMNRAYAALQPMISAGGSVTRHSSEATLAFGPVIQAYTDYQLYANGLAPVPLPEGELKDFMESEIVIQPLTSYGFQASAVWGLLNARTLPLLKMARATIQGAEHLTTWAQRELLHGVAQAYYGLYGLQLGRDVLKRQLEARERHHTMAEARFAAGQIPKTEVLRAEVEVVQALRQLRDGHQMVHRMAAEIATLLGRLDLEIRASLPASQTVPGGSDEDLVKSALSRRPDYLAGAEMLLAAEQALLDSKLDFLPTVALQATYSYSNAGGFSGENDSWNVGALASLPLWDGGVRVTNVREARQKLVQARAAQRKVELQIRKDVELASSTFQQALVNQEASEVELRLAKSTLEQMEALYQAGRATALELKDVELLVTGAEQNRVRVGLERDLAILALQRAVGTFGSAPASDP